MKQTLCLGVTLLGCVAVGGSVVGKFGNTFAAQASPASVRQVPTFQPDPSWPKLPAKWVLGWASDIFVDAQDHVWVLHRPRTVKPEQQGMAAPPVLEFDAAGNFIQGWGGEGDGYEWPAIEHGIFVDHKGFVWLGGEGKDSHQVLKFTKAGKFVMQLGRRGQTGSTKDTKTFGSVSDVFVHAKTNELFVGDEHGNARVIVFDADTGAFKRMWGAFGRPATDPAPGELNTWRIGWVPGPDGPDESPDGRAQLCQAHGVRVSNDGFVYVADGPCRRFQVFTIDGKFVKQVFVNREKRAVTTGTLAGEQGRMSYAELEKLGKSLKDIEQDQYSHHETASRLALSADPQQRFLYIMERGLGNILVYDRKTLEMLGSFGDGPGAAPGQLYGLHDVRADSKGNVYVAENRNMRVQKFVFRGMVPASTTK